MKKMARYFTATAAGSAPFSGLDASRWTRDRNDAEGGDAEAGRKQLPLTAERDEQQHEPDEPQRHGEAEEDGSQ
jgi:hypothetical protein